jgi:hypothetical protein
VTDARGIVYERFAQTGAPPSAGDAVRMAHPFSAAPMGFVVRGGDRLWWGGCAWDSFGIAAEWWEDVVATCTDIRTFCSPEHAPSGGALVPAPIMWRLALTWYGNRLDPDYVPLSTERKRALLAELGLGGPFWRLP